MRQPKKMTDLNHFDQCQRYTSLSVIHCIQFCFLCTIFWIFNGEHGFAMREVNSLNRPENRNYEDFLRDSRRHESQDQPPVAAVPGSPSTLDGGLSSSSGGSSETAEELLERKLEYLKAIETYAESINRRAVAIMKSDPSVKPKPNKNRIIPQGSITVSVEEIQANRDNNIKTLQEKVPEMTAYIQKHRSSLFPKKTSYDNILVAYRHSLMQNPFVPNSAQYKELILTTEKLRKSLLEEPSSSGTQKEPACTTPAPKVKVSPSLWQNLMQKVRGNSNTVEHFDSIE